MFFHKSKKWGWAVFGLFFIGSFFLPQFQFELDPNDPNDIHLGVFGVALIWLAGLIIGVIVNILQGFGRRNRFLDQDIPEAVAALMIAATTLIIGALITPWDAIWTWQQHESSHDGNIFLMLLGFLFQVFGPFLIAPAIVGIAILLASIGYKAIEYVRCHRMRNYSF